jgi:hypothetical protein
VGTTKLGYAATADGIDVEDPVGSSAEVLRERTPQQARELRKLDDRRWRVNVTVTALVPELNKALVESDDGLLRLSISKRTEGVSVRDLRPGQHLRVMVQGVLAPKVLSATLA